MSRCKLEEFISYEQPAKYIVDSDQYDDSYETPVLTAGKSFILGYTDEKNNIFDNLPVIIFDDFTTSVQFVDFPFKVKSSAMKLLKNTEQADIKYCYYLLKFLQHTPENHKRQWLSATSQNIVELPTIEKQNNIVRKLDKILEVIDNQNKQLELLDEAIKARFVEMFGDISINDKNWNNALLGELCKIVRGGSPRPIEKFLGGEVPWIKIGDATKGDNIYLHSTKEHIISEGVSKSRLVKAGSLIFANCGVSLGFARIITFDGCIHDGWLALEDIDERLDKVFLLQSLNQMTEHFRSIAPAGTQPNLNTAIMKKYRQVIPPIELQREFIVFCEEIDKSRSRIQKSLEASQELFDSLMQEYFG